MSVGQLLAMKPHARAKAIAALPQGARVRLAHLASLGIRNALEKVAAYQTVLEALTAEEEAS